MELRNGLPPARCFEEPLDKGALRGTKLDRAKYEVMLKMYYRKRAGMKKESRQRQLLKSLA